MRGGKAGESCNRLGPTAHGALITNLTPRSRSSTRKGCYRRLVMRFHNFIKIWAGSGLARNALAQDQPTTDQPSAVLQLPRHCRYRHLGCPLH